MNECNRKPGHMRGEIQFDEVGGIWMFHTVPCLHYYFKAFVVLHEIIFATFVAMFGLY